MLRRALLDILFPLFCLGCGAEGSVLCVGCNKEILLPGIWRDDVLSLATYDEASMLGRLITNYKYEYVTAAGAVLAELVGRFWTARASVWARPDFIIPTPLHRRRAAERGFNQSELVARALGQALFVPVKTKILARTRATKQQATLTRAERITNVRDAFRVTKPTQVAGRSVWLVDDVYTTGSTFRAAAQALHAAGATFVRGFTIARG